MAFDISSFLFGDKTPVVTPTSTSTTVTQGTPAEQAARQALLGTAGQVYDQTSQAVQAFSGTPGIAAPSQSTLTAEQMALGLVPGMEGMNANLSNAYNFGLGAANLESNPYFQQAITAALNPITDAYRENVMPAIGQGGVTAGQYGGSRQGIAEGIASGKYLRTLGDVSGSMAGDAYKTGLQTMLGTMGQTPTVQNAMMMPAGITAGVGGAQDVRAQNVLDDAAAQALWKINAPWQPLTNYANLVYGGGTTSATTNATGQMVTPSQDKGLIGSIAPIASMALGLKGLSIPGLGG